MAEKIVPGDTLQIQSEPDNAHDGKAVLLLFDGQQLGYVSARYVICIADIINNKRSFRIKVTEIHVGGDARQVDLYLDTCILSDMDAF